MDPRKPGQFKYGNYYFDYEPFYIGKGKNARLLDHIKYINKNKMLYNKIKKIKTETDKDPIIKILIENLGEEEAFLNESLIITSIGRKNLKSGPLCNLTNGGEGPSGRHPTNETRIKLSIATSGENNPMFGRHHTEDSKKLIGEKNSKCIRTEEFKKHTSEHNKGSGNPTYGKIYSNDERKNISDGLRNFWDNASDEYRDNFRKMRRENSKKGEKNPMYGKERLYMKGELNPSKRPESRKKISEKLKESWKKRKELKQKEIEKEAKNKSV
jgi:hypothetical protein